MKHSFPAKFLISAVFVLSGFASFSQSVAINTDGGSAQASAMLEVKSTVKGFLPPRMLEAQRNAIVTPVAGLTVWCTDCGPSGEMQVYNGTTWTNMTGGAASSNNTPTVFICGKEWTRYNLNVSTYTNGQPITQVTAAGTWGSTTSGAWCYYDNDIANEAVYGKLYNWYAVNDPRGLVPTGWPAGWRVPTDADWTALENCLNTLYPGQAGGALKEAGTSNWLAPNAGATNVTNFRGLPGGARSEDGTLFFGKGEYGNMWSTTVGTSGSVFGFYHFLWNLDANFYKGEDLKRTGFSVRLVKD